MAKVDCMMGWRGTYGRLVFDFFFRFSFSDFILIPLILYLLF